LRRSLNEALEYIKNWNRFASFFVVQINLQVQFPLSYLNGKIF